MRTFFVVAIGLVCCWASGCHTAGYNTRQGGLTGGLAGTAIGAAVGASEGKALEGALIGGTTGGLFGSAIGNNMDRAEAEEYAVQQASYNQVVSAALSTQQVAEMANSGLSDSVIMGQIQSSGIQRSVTAEDLVWLKQRGVTDEVIGAMQRARTPQTAVAQRNIPRPVIIEERYIHAPPHCGYACPPPYFHHRHRRHRRNGVHWHVDF